MKLRTYLQWTVAAAAWMLIGGSAHTEEQDAGHEIIRLPARAPVVRSDADFFSTAEQETAGAEQLPEDDETDLPFMPYLPGSDVPSADERMVGLKYDDWDVDAVLKDYSDWTGLALMKAPDLPSPQITLKCPKRLPLSQALFAIESILAMHGIALVPMGDTFLKVVPIATARQEGMPITVEPIPKEAVETDHLVSQIVTLKHIDISEAQQTIQGLMHQYGKIMPLERVNSMLITDTAINIKRILEILQYIDQPVAVREELRIFRIVYAKASEIMAKIQAIIADAETREDARADLIRQQLAAARRIARAAARRRPDQPMPEMPQPVQEPSEERGLIHARVKMVADDRTGSLIVITRPEQFQFLENIIAELDVQVDPDVNIKVFRLQYAKSEDVVSVLNAIIASGAGGGPAVPVRGRDREAAREEERAPTGETEITGRLSEDVKIIADPRINALLVMANRADMTVIESVMNQLDIMLSQVLIEVIIVEIGLDDRFQSGVDWLQRSMIAYTEPGGGRRGFMGFSGVSRSGASAEIRDATSIRRIGDSTAAAGSGLSYYFTFFDYNLDLVLNVLAESSEARLLSTPIILTTDNTEARILVGEKRPIVTATSITTGGYQQSTYQYTDIGIELKVTPYINKDGFVVMDIHQNVDNVHGYVTIDGNQVPVIVTREFSALLSVDDGRTVVVGGLTSSDKKEATSGIPLLRHIPLLGRLFRSDYDEHYRRELLVMLTPYVLDTPDKVYQATQRRSQAIKEATELIQDSWSESELLESGPAQKEEEPDQS